MKAHPLSYWLSYCWRLFGTGFSFFLFGVGGVIITLIIFPLIFALIWNPKKRIIYSRKLINLAFKGFVGVMQLLGVMRWRVENLERLNRQGLIVIANHPTLLDIVYLISLIPNADCIVKGDLLKNPAMRGALLITGYITNDSGTELVNNASRSLAEGGNIVVFPEGTRSVGELNKFKRGVANIALKSGRNLTPVVIRCSEVTLRKNQPWYDIPDQPFEILISVKDDICIEQYQLDERRLGVRKLTKYLEEYYTKELEKT